MTRADTFLGLSCLLFISGAAVGDYGHANLSFAVVSVGSALFLYWLLSDSP